MNTSLKTLVAALATIALFPNHSAFAAANPSPGANGGGRGVSSPPFYMNIKSVGGGVATDPNAVITGQVTHDVYSPSQIAASLNGRPLQLDARGNFQTTVKLDAGINNLSLDVSSPNPRQQITQISTYIDGTMIYGTDAARARALRAFTGGKLKTSTGNLMPLNTGGFANANDAHIFADNQLFLAGDVRANENSELIAIQTLFVREHNTLADAIAAANPGLTDEQIFQLARKLVIAELQVITYEEFLPALLGQGVLKPYRGYRPDVAPGLATEFSTGAFRIGHTMINDDVGFVDNEGVDSAAALPLAEAFFNPAPVKEKGIDPIIKYLATDNAQEIDTQLVGGLRNFLFGPPGAGGLDLASLNIQRGRDHGIADYNSVRLAYGLPAVRTVADITRDPALQTSLIALYGSVNDMDLWVAGLAEDHVPGSSVGPTFSRIMADQFERTRDGDSNWYEVGFSGPQLDALRITRLSDIIRRNTTITKIQDNVFFFNEATTLAELTARPGIVPQALVSRLNPVKNPSSLDGSGNNRQHPAWAAAGSDLLRLSPAAYADMIAAPSGANRPSARAISNKVSVSATSTANSRMLSSWAYGWGQFIDHDLGLTTSESASINIPVPTGDKDFDPRNTGTASIPMSRSVWDATTGSSSAATAQQVLTVTLKTPPPPKRPAPR